MNKNLQKELADINAKCDLIIELLDSLSSNPDFVIERMRAVAFRQSVESGKERKSCLKVLHNDSE